jgi:predicted RNA-binding protein (TIGR00451 family)
MLAYHFSHYAANILEYINVSNIEICLSKTTSRLRAFLYNKKLFAFVRASDSYLIPHAPLAVLLHKVLPFPKMRVVVVNEIVDDLLEGHTVFARHVILADETIKPFEEVLIVNEDDKLIGLGRAILDYETMITSTYGVAVQIREKIRDGENL